jgi:hypothetical protein
MNASKFNKRRTDMGLNSFAVTAGGNTYIKDGTGTVVDDRLNVSGDWALTPEKNETYHIKDVNGREWDSKLKKFSGDTGTFKMPPGR